MIKNTCIFLCSLIAFIIPAAAEKTKEDFMNTIQSHPESLLIATNKYVDFINRIGKGEIFAQMEEAASIIAPECKKIFNGHLFAKNRADFVADLLSVHKNHGSWQIIPIELIRASSDDIVILRLIIEAETFGTNTAIVILRYDSDYLITEINEVFSQIKGSYDFQNNEIMK